MQPNEPRGIDLLALLIDLLADQEGVKITYELGVVKGKEQEHEKERMAYISI